MDRRAFMGLASAGILAGCGAQRFNSGRDAAFQAMVEDAMPDYALTPAMIGKPIRVSPVHPMYVTPPSRDGAVSLRPKDVLFADYLRVFEDYGLPQVRILFRDREYYPDLAPLDQPYWAVDFPGFAPGQCEAVAANAVFQRSSRSEYSLYGGPGGSLERFDLVEAEIEGVRYRAGLGVSFDAAGRVKSYRVGSYREPLSAFEELEANQYGGWLQVWGYENNLTLGIAVELNGPDRISRYL